MFLRSDFTTKLNNLFTNVHTLHNKNRDNLQICINSCYIKSRRKLHLHVLFVKIMNLWNSKSLLWNTKSIIKTRCSVWFLKRGFLDLYFDPGNSSLRVIFYQNNNVYQNSCQLHAYRPEVIFHDLRFFLAAVSPCVELNLLGHHRTEERSKLKFYNQAT